MDNWLCSTWNQRPAGDTQEREHWDGRNWDHWSMANIFFSLHSITLSCCLLINFALSRILKLTMHWPTVFLHISFWFQIIHLESCWSFLLHLSCLTLIFLLILTPTLSAPISRLDLWKRLYNFLEDYSDGFTQYQSEQMWGPRNSPQLSRCFLSSGQRAPPLPENRADVNVFNHAPACFLNISPSVPVHLFPPSVFFEITRFQLYETCCYND